MTCLVHFGYPRACKDAAHRAVQAGLAITTMSPGEETFRIGIHTGEMLVGAQKSGRWQDRDLIGPVVEIARSCQRLANPGEVLITEAVWRLVQGDFDVQPLEPRILGPGGQKTPIYRVYASQWENLYWSTIGRANSIAPDPRSATKRT